MLHLIAQAAGVLLVVGVAGWFTGARSWAALRLPAVAVTAAVLCAAFLAQLPVSARDLNRSRRAGQAVPAEALRSGCLSSKRDTVTSFFAWARVRLPRKARYFYVGARSLGPDDYTCVTFSLLPAIRTPTPNAARYVVFAGAIPADLRPRMEQTEQFAPNFGIARLDRP